MSLRPPAAERLCNPAALLTRGDLAELGLERHQRWTHRRPLSQDRDTTHSLDALDRPGPIPLISLFH